MGGTAQEQDALKGLETIRKVYDQNCNYQNEKNWVNSVACMNRITLSKILFYNEIIHQVLDIPGAIIELGVQWGALTSLLLNLTSIHEPFNFRRKVVGFDTFAGFPESSLTQSELSQGWQANDLSTCENIENIISNCLDLHQTFSAMNHMTRHELVAGDVHVTLQNWLDSNPHESVALCIFDMDLYQPTRCALEKILHRSQKGTVLVFDEYSHPLFPGEAKAVRELLDIHQLKPIKSPLLPYTSYIVL